MGAASIQLNNRHLPGQTQKNDGFASHKDWRQKWIYLENFKRKKSWVDPFQPPSLRPSFFGSKVVLCVWWGDQRCNVYYELMKPGETVDVHRHHQQTFIFKFHRALNNNVLWDFDSNRCFCARLHAIVFRSRVCNASELFWFYARAQTNRRRVGRFLWWPGNVKCNELGSNGLIAT